MKSLFSTVLAALLGLGVSGIVFAAEEPRSDQPAAQTQQGGQTQQDNEAFTAALKKCDGLPADQKTKCIDAAKRKFGQM